MVELSRVEVIIRLEGAGEAKAELIRYLSPKTVDAIIRNLPLSGRVACWGEELYFEIPVKMGPEKPRTVVKAGDLAYWPMGSALCIFYRGSRPYSPVNMVGRVVENLFIFGGVKAGSRIVVERL